ncbi:AGC/GRK/BARK protein kinase [Phytophthora megakarya]|uniref:AGC/GRK/BARK protein kinase n=1 Tax=Phytophthora megakarya TaxID=4795 RepID=A0A225VGZ9_9STRA|nr:AGC/GRK/BARK protein kinase [Phytophthora megakarya]
MDELHDAIQDAQYIGAVTNTQRGPSAAFYNPSSNELSQFVDRQERALGSDWLGLENLLDMPLGFYFFRRFCEAEQHGSRKLDLLVEITKYRTISATSNVSNFAGNSTIIFARNGLFIVNGSTT